MRLPSALQNTTPLGHVPAAEPNRKSPRRPHWAGIPLQSFRQKQTFFFDLIHLDDDIGVLLP
jgi:hypothetical protein